MSAKPRGRNVIIHLPPELCGEGGESEFTVAGATAAEALASLGRQLPELADRLLDGRRGIRPYFTVLLGDEVLRSLAEPLPARARLTVLAPIAGG